MSEVWYWTKYDRVVVYHGSLSFYGVIYYDFENLDGDSERKSLTLMNPREWNMEFVGIL